MPITYSIDRDQRVIFEKWTGEVTAAELRDYWRRFLADLEVMALRRTLVDLRQCRVLFTGTELSSLVRYLVIPTLEGRDWKTAIVVENLVHFGVSRQYQVFAESYIKDSIFVDPAAALEWLLA